MTALTIVSFIFLQLDIPTPKDYTAAILGIIYAALIWSLNRNVKKQDDEIKEVADNLEKLQVSLSLFKDKIESDRFTTQREAFERVTEIQDKLNQISLKIAELRPNDNHVK
jgi:peptidoglycan hydrolase CwlO-like protein